MDPALPVITLERARNNKIKVLVVYNNSRISDVYLAVIFSHFTFEVCGKRLGVFVYSGEDWPAVGEIRSVCIMFVTEWHAESKNTC